MSKFLHAYLAKGTIEEIWAELNAKRVVCVGGFGDG